MGPILGEPFPTKPYSPNDDRIVHLNLHRSPVVGEGNALDLAMWWRFLGATQTKRAGHATT